MHGDQASDGLHPELTNCCSVEVAGGCQARFSWGVPTFVVSQGVLDHTDVSGK